MWHSCWLSWEGMEWGDWLLGYNKPRTVIGPVLNLCDMAHNDRMSSVLCTLCHFVLSLIMRLSCVWLLNETLCTHTHFLESFRVLTGLLLGESCESQRSELSEAAYINVNLIFLRNRCMCFSDFSCSKWLYSTKLWHWPISKKMNILT